VAEPQAVRPLGIIDRVVAQLKVLARKLWGPR
jgi:hypothetical protein